LRGLRAFVAGRATPPYEVLPPPGRRKYWSRRGLAEWLAERLCEPVRSIVGIDHGFSFPLAYFDAHGLALDWAAFLDDFQRHWPTDADDVTVDAVRSGSIGDGATRSGNSRWRRIADIRAGAKSVFHFDVQGSVAKSTHTGLPWLRFLRQRAGDRVHFWPFDGWSFPAQRSVVVEAYPALWNRGVPAAANHDPHQHDAFCIAAWLRATDAAGRLAAFTMPRLSAAERETASIEGWILGSE
jgi:hypothetical protein